MADNRTLANRIVTTDLGLLDDMFREYMSRHSWYRKHANTIKTAIIGLLSLVGLVVSLGVELPAYAIVGIAGIGLLAQLFGVDDPEKAVQKAVAKPAGGKHRA